MDGTSAIQDTPMSELLQYWIREREAVREKKEAGLPKPWSEDPVFQTVYFCNVHREDDKVTKYVRAKYSPWVDHEMFLPNIMLARLVNRIESLEAIGYVEQWSDKHFFDAASDCSPFWGSAYVVSTHGMRMDKLSYACDALRSVFAAQPRVSTPTLNAAHSAIQGAEGFGSFMAAQVVADLKNTPGHPLYDAEDWYTWSAHGPGSLRGLSWYHGFKVTPTTYQPLIQQAAEDINWDGCMQDLQNVFCEFSKYCKVKSGQGRSKRKYEGK